MPQHSHGLTLLELLACIAIAAIVAAMAAPGFGEYLGNARRTATVNALLHAIHAARAAAAARGTPEVLCGTDDLRSCSGRTDWTRGALQWSDPVPGVEALDTPPPRVLQFDANGRQQVRSNRAEIRFQPRSAAATTATITVCDDRGARAARAIVVSRTGRPRVSDRDGSGAVLACP